MATLGETEVWPVRKEGSMILEKQLAVSATAKKETHYISQSPEAERAAGSTQRCRQRPKQFPSLHSTTHSIGFSLGPARLHLVGWLPVAIRLHASLFISSGRVWSLKSKEARGHLEAQTLHNDWYPLNTFPYSGANRGLLANKGFHSQILVRWRGRALHANPVCLGLHLSEHFPSCLSLNKLLSLSEPQFPCV